MDSQIFSVDGQESVSMDLAGRTFTFKAGTVADQAQGSVIAMLDDIVLLGTAGFNESPRPDAGWFPLMVDFEERYYAAGKIKGSRFIKREGRPSDKAVLTARLIDRPIRPLFPKGAINDVQIIITALSVDQEVDAGTTGINAASMALLLSGMPFAGPVGAVRMGYFDGQIIVNPTYTQVAEGALDLVVAGTADAITMVEAGAKEVSEDILLEALQKAHEEIKKICAMQEDLKAKFNPEPLVMTTREENIELKKTVSEWATKEKLDTAVGKSKKEFKKNLHALEEQLIEHCTAQIEAEEFKEGELKGELLNHVEGNMRRNILDGKGRLDGRAADEIRPISCYVGLLPRTHGSALFVRGETQALSVTTLAGPARAQIIDTMDVDQTLFYFHHYNFPPYSVGEVKPQRGTSRREIGHGDLAERALLPVLPDRADFGYVMRVVSEILACNGSSSMASVCGSTLSLMDAGVPLKRPVAGIAMGLVTDPEKPILEGGSYVILSDIQGMEDFAGDMDFKVTGTTEGITALQMDIKVKGITIDLMREALDRAREGRQHILDKMLAVLPEARKEMSQFAPTITTIEIDPDLIKVVIGKGGETIQKITKETGAEIDIEQDGIITITAVDQEGGKEAVEWIKKLTYVPEVGDEFEGKVVRIMDFGCFVEIAPGKDGLVHISQLANHRVENVTDVVKEGDTLKVKLMEIDDKGRYNLSHKVLLEKEDKAT